MMWYFYLLSFYTLPHHGTVASSLFHVNYSQGEKQNSREQDCGSGLDMGHFSSALF